jgi:hypothetical protein
MTPELKEALIKDAKELGLDLIEDNVKKSVEFFFMAIPKIAAESENKIDDAIAQFLPLVKPMLMELVDKLDGEEDL